MKILKRPTQIFRRVMNIDNISCPFCGECKKYNPMSNSNGIESYRKIWFSGIFRIRKCSKDVFICRTCKAKWEENHTSEVINKNNCEEK